MCPEYKEIIELPMDDLIQKLQTRELTAKSVMEAFIAKSLEATDEFNCITEFHPRAIEFAEELDRLETPKGPLHGIPFCVKDDTNVAEMDSTVGCARNLYRPAEQSAVIVQTLQDLGGIPYCRTNVPQTCTSFASHNPIFGQTKNPLNNKLGPGGSSSGTGCLIGSRSCLFGIGSDSAGSARLPAHFCGISTIKTSKNRVSRKGSLQCIECIGLPPIPCLIAQKSADVATIFKSLTEQNSMNKYDLRVVPLNWNPTLFVSNEKLRIGYFASLDICPTLGDTPDTILKAKSILESLGHTLIPFELPKAEHYLKILTSLNHADLGEHFVTKLKNEEISPSINELYNYFNVPFWKKKLSTYLPGWVSLGHGSESSGINVFYSTDLWDCMSDRQISREKLLEEINEMKLDLILSPAFPTPALPLEVMYTGSLTRGTYLCIWNLMDFPAGIVPVGVESGQHISKIAIQSNDDNFTKLAKKRFEETIGMPIGVQIIGKPYQEEVVLRVMVELEKHIHTS